MVTIRKPKNALKFSRPASWWGSTWREALPTGNGVIGASVYGGAGKDVILLNHGDLWWQGHVGVLQDVSDRLKDVRKFIDAESPEQAQDILSKGLITKNYRPQHFYPLPLCDFKIDMPVDKGIKEYQRVINMENGEVSVSFKDGSTRYDRSVFVSRENGLVCYEVTKAGAKNINVNFSFDAHEKFNARTLNSVSKLPEAINVKYENYFMYFSARSDNGTEFGAVAHIKHFGGTQTVDATTGITIKGAEKVLVLIKVFVESQREKEWKNAKAMLAGIKLTYDKLLKEHTTIHNRLFTGADVDLDAEDRDAFVEDLIDDTYKTGNISKALVEKLWGYGRYLLLCGAGTDTQPIAPYGLWCGDYKAEGSQINAFGTLQTMYAQALGGNLCDHLLSVFSYYESVMDDLKKNSSRLYACRGIMIPAIMAHGTGAPGSIDPEVTNFTAATGWICQLFYDYYLYTGDTKFLKTRALPFMKDAATFYEEFFKVVGGKYESSPSYSPFTTPGNRVRPGEKLTIARNATIDFAVAKELLTNLISGAKAAGMYKDEIEKWKDMLTRIPDYKINPDGSVGEYCDPEYADNYASASTAVYYPVFPGTEVNAGTPDMMKAFAQTAKKKFAGSGNDQNAENLARYACVFARTQDGDEALEAMTDLVRGMSMGNLIFAANDWRGMGLGVENIWAPFSLEANMGVTAAVQEMLVQSTETLVSILPALPGDMRSGSASGLLTKAGVEVVSLDWDYKKGIVTAKLKAKKASVISLKLPGGAKRFKGGNNGEKFDAENALVSNFSLAAGKVVAVEIRL